MTVISIRWVNIPRSARPTLGQKHGRPPRPTHPQKSFKPRPTLCPKHPPSPLSIVFSLLTILQGHTPQFRVSRWYEPRARETRTPSALPRVTITRDCGGQRVVYIPSWSGGTASRAGPRDHFATPAGRPRTSWRLSLVPLAVAYEARKRSYHGTAEDCVALGLTFLPIVGEPSGGGVPHAILHL